LKLAAPRPLSALVTNTRPPQTTGLECASPGRVAFHSTFSPVLTSHVSGRSWPSATPEARGPRKLGQLPEAGAAAGSLPVRAGVSAMRRSGITRGSSFGAQLLRSSIMRRKAQSSLCSVNETCGPWRWNE
jgi:hypothetical protein